MGRCQTWRRRFFFQSPNMQPAMNNDDYYHTHPGIPFFCKVRSSSNPQEYCVKTDKKQRRVRLKRTNLRVRGLSLNRSQKWTALLSTTPRLRPRSSTNDLAPLHRVWLVSLSARGRVCRRPPRAVVLWLCHRGGRNRSPPRISSPADVEALTVSSRFSGRDSDLEAFSHNPSDGSVAPLAYQPST